MTLDEARARRMLWPAVAVALLLRLAFGTLYWTGQPLTHDEREYLSLAQGLVEGRGLVYDESIDVGTGQRFGRAPGYPLFLAAIGAGSAGTDTSHGTPLRVKVAQSAAGAVGVWLLALLARRAGGERAGVAAAWVAAVYPPLVIIPAYVLSETVYSVVALASALALQVALARSARGGRGLGSAALSGGLAGAAALVRPAMLFFLPLAALWLVVKRSYAAAALVAAASILVILPWTIRNAGVYQRFVLIASEGGVTFWTGNHPLATGEGDLAANPAIKRAELEFRAGHPGLTAEQMEPLYYSDALSYMRAHPVWWLQLVGRKAFFTIVPAGPSYALHSTSYRLASALPYLLLLPFAAAGARRLWRRPEPPVAAALLAGSAVIVCLIFFPQERFRIPVIDPMLILCASGLAGRTRS